MTATPIFGYPYTPILQAVDNEIQRSIALHGEMPDSRHAIHSIILEEFDEFWDEVKLNPAKMTEEEREAWKLRMGKELIQVAAMAVKGIKALELPYAK